PPGRVLAGGRGAPSGRSYLPVLSRRRALGRLRAGVRGAGLAVAPDARVGEGRPGARSRRLPLPARADPLRLRPVGDAPRARQGRLVRGERPGLAARGPAAAGIGRSPDHQAGRAPAPVDRERLTHRPGGARPLRGIGLDARRCRAARAPRVRGAGWPRLLRRRARAPRGGDGCTGEEEGVMSADTSRARSLDLLSWSRTYRIEAGGALDFDAFPFQRELYEAFGDPGIRRVAVMKAAQCGISAAGVSLALYAADAWGANVLYVLPGFVDAHDFSDTRVAPTIRASASLRP